MSDCCVVPIRFMNISTIAHKTVRFVEIAPADCRPQNRTVVTTYVTLALVILRIFGSHDFILIFILVLPGWLHLFCNVCGLPGGAVGQRQLIQ